MKFKDFLKKYSNLNNEFITDFYNIYDFNETFLIKNQRFFIKKKSYYYFTQ